MIDTTATIYRAYAPIYDAIGQDRFGMGMACWALGWLAARGAPIERVLDLACGTGAATLVFAAAGHAVVGVDRSAAMLDIARGKARDAGYRVDFVASDIRELTTTDDRPTIDDRPPTNDEGPTIGNRPPTNDESTTDDRRPTTDDQGSVSSFIVYRSSFPSPCHPVSLPPASFDLATCFYDSLNYLTDDGDLALVFGGVARLLRPGGHLIFDLNMEAEYRTWDELDVVTYDSSDCLVYNRLSYDAAARRATGRVVWFVREIDRWWRDEETHIERAWRDAEVAAALDRAGLTLLARLSVQGAAIAAGADAVPRVVYVARKEYL